MSQRLETVLTAVVTVCAVAVAITFVYQQVLRRSITDPGNSPEREPTYVGSWDRLVQGGVRVGPASATVQIVEFGDFQCPFCRIFHDAVSDVMDELPGDVSKVFYHYPLSSHEFAEAAARAAVCATEQGRFAEMASELYALQDSLGLRPWVWYARRAGVVDTSSLLRCMDDSATQARIELDRSVAAELAVKGTPTVIINGWRLPVPPTVDSLRHIANEVVAGRSPFTAN